MPTHNHRFLGLSCGALGRVRLPARGGSLAAFLGLVSAALVPKPAGKAGKVSRSLFLDLGPGRSRRPSFEERTWGMNKTPADQTDQ